MEDVTSGPPPPTTTSPNPQTPHHPNPTQQAFLSAVVRDEAYMAKTWEVTTPWNKALRAELAARFPAWKVFGEEYLSWVWVRRLVVCGFDGLE